MVREFGFVLAVKANVRATPANPFPAQMKVARSRKFAIWFSCNCLALCCALCPVAPPQIPWHAGYSYFELEKGSELWHEMDKSGAFALHLAGEFPGLDMEFWAIRSRLNNKASA